MQTKNSAKQLQQFTKLMPSTFKNRIALINQESAKIWQGNITIHFKNNEDNRLKLEELVSNLAVSCSVPEIGFGRGEQFAEKN